MRMRQVAHGFEVAGLGDRTRDRLHHDRGDIAGVALEERLERVDVVVRERLDERAQHLRDALDAPARDRVPVVEPVYAVLEDEVSASRGARDPDRGRNGVRPVLPERHHLRARHHVDQQARDVDLHRMRERQCRARAELRPDGLLHRRMAIAEDDGAPAHHPVDVRPAARVHEFVTIPVRREARQRLVQLSARVKPLPEAVVLSRRTQHRVGLGHQDRSRVRHGRFVRPNRGELEDRADAGHVGQLAMR